jgi:hypothetical protein
LNEYSTEIPGAPGYYVYRLWAGGTCLYVGRAGNSGPQRVARRLADHRRNKPWWSEVTRIEVAAFASHDLIVAEEYRQIEARHPVHNKQRRGAAAQAAWRAADARAYSQRPEIKARRAAQARERRQRPEVKARQSEYNRAYHQRPEIKAREQVRRREYGRRPEVRERTAAQARQWRREHPQSPEANARKRERQREYYRRPEVKARKREYAREYSQRTAVKAANRERQRRRRQRAAASGQVAEWSQGTLWRESPPFPRGSRGNPTIGEGEG